MTKLTHSKRDSLRRVLKTEEPDERTCHTFIYSLWHAYSDDVIIRGYL